LAPAAFNNASGAGRLAALCVIAAAWLPVPATARVSHLHPSWPFEITGSQYAPVAWADIAGWSEDDHLQAFKAFRASCNPISVQRKPPTDPKAKDSKALGISLRDPCRAAGASEIPDDAKARAFFEANFLPMRISRLGEPEGFVTGYYEPIIDGSRTKTDVYTVPVYRRPSNLFVRGMSQASSSMPNGGEVFRKIGRRKLVPYYDRAEIEDGAIAGRGLEICWLKNQTDLLFTQIQGSARVRLEDGGMVRINYDAHNGFRYTPVGRILIDRNIIPREQMSMQRIRQWMEENPDGANELRRQNRSYVFFREVQLSATDEAVGAQGVPLTPGRSIAVDKSLHVYGTPFFIEGELPIDSEQSKTPFRRLMVAQDTGSAIVGPARADIYFGAGADAGKVSGRLRHPARFVMLVPKSLDPVEKGRALPLPHARPSEHIAKLFPQKTEPTKPDPAKDVKEPPNKTPESKAPDSKAPDKPVAKTPVGNPAVAAPVVKDTPSAPEAAKTSAPATAQVQPAAKPVPLPEARPEIKPEVKSKRRVNRRVRHHRRHRFFWE
jgi:membrane-bound lytic murein transglycosylase A